MDQIIAHVHLNIGAGQCLARMLTNNAQLVSVLVSMVTYFCCVRMLASLSCAKLSQMTD